jgi:erythromycin esterase
MPRTLLAPARFALLALLLSACGDSPAGPPPPPPPPPPPAAVDLSWLRTHAHPLRTAAPEGSFDDLAPLRAMIGDARMVGLGEATHGTREIFTMKHRLLEYLVKEMGFTTFGIEATYAEALAVNEWVHGGAGDPEVLLSDLRFWTWNTEEVLEMMRWMRRHNENPGAAPRVSFYGFDMQFSRVAMNRVESFLRGIDPEAADSVTRLYACYRAFQDMPGAATPDYRAAPAVTQVACRTGVRGARELLESHRDRYVSGDATPYEYAHRAARVVEQNEESRGMGGTGVVRERSMAENSRWLLERPGAPGRVVLWAHNAHVWTEAGWQGGFLKQELGDAYRVLGFSIHSGTVTARDAAAGNVLRTMTVPAPPGESYEAEFHRLGSPIFLADLRPLRSALPPESRWLQGPRAQWMIGAVFNEQSPGAYQLAVRLPQAYDLLIHIDRTTHTRVLPFRFSPADRDGTKVALPLR